MTQVNASTVISTTIPPLVEARSMPCYPPCLPASRHYSDAELDASIASTLKQQTENDIWLFAYGSLIWKPEGPAVEYQSAQIKGYHRGLNLWSRIHRGTPERPGLVLGLDRGGECNGVAFRLPKKNLDQQLKALWRREMPDDSYRPEWLSCDLKDGRQIQVLTFVLEQDHANYAGHQPDHVLKEVFAQAQGYCGTSRDYLSNTIKALRAKAMPDLKLEAMFSRCAS